MRKISGPKTEEVIGEWRKMYNEELHNLCSSSHVVVVVVVNNNNNNNNLWALQSMMNLGLCFTVS
jgi:hypothetical protein